MTRHAILHEHLTKADHSIGFTLGSLQDANLDAPALVSLIVLDAIRIAAELQTRIRAIRDAVAEDPTPELVAALSRCVEVIGHNPCSSRGGGLNEFAIALDIGRNTLAKVAGR